MPTTAPPKAALIIAREANMAGIVADMLRTQGYRQVLEVTDAGLVSHAFARRAFDVIVLDDAIARPDAIQIVRRLRADAAALNRMTPVILMAAAPDATRIAAARDAGVTEVLRVPFSAAQLKARLDGFDSRPRDFVTAPGFTGPDRRRREATEATPQRRADDQD